MKKIMLFVTFISLLAVSCKESELLKDDALEGDNNGTNIGPGKDIIKDTTHIHDHDTSNAHMH